MKEKKIFDIEQVGFGDEIGFRIPPRRVSKPIIEPPTKPKNENRVENTQKYAIKETRKIPPIPQPKPEPVHQQPSRNTMSRKTKFAVEEFISPITGSKHKKPQVVHVAYGEYQWKGSPIEEEHNSIATHQEIEKRFGFEIDEVLGESLINEIGREQGNNEVEDEILIDSEITANDFILTETIIQIDEEIANQSENEEKMVELVSETLSDEQTLIEIFAEKEVLSDSKLQNEESNVVVEDEILIDDTVLVEIFSEDDSKLELTFQIEEEIFDNARIEEDDLQLETMETQIEKITKNDFMLMTDFDEVEEVIEENSIMITKEPSFLIEEEELSETIETQDEELNMVINDELILEEFPEEVAVPKFPSPIVNEQKIMNHLTDNSLETAKNLLDNVITKFFSEEKETQNEEEIILVEEESMEQVEVASNQEENMFGKTGTLHDVDGVLDILNNEGTVNSLIESLLLEDGLVVDGNYSDVTFISEEHEDKLITLETPTNPIIESGFTPIEGEIYFEKENNLTEVVEEETLYYETPSLDLLDDSEVKDKQNEDWIIEKMEIIEQTFNNFGVKVRLTGEFTQGPTITQIEIQPEAGTKMSKIVGLINDLKLNLSVEELRIEPIAGKNTIGIEVPNPNRRLVKLKDVLSRPEFVLHESPLCIGLGEDIAGNPVYSDILKMPHGLIAGQTGSGKSVCINTLLISILYKASPEEVRLMLIDPKRVELAPYNNIPHLVTPVITDEKKAADGLKWAVNEMERRYELFAQNGVREIKAFNSRRHEFDMDYPKMPYIVVIIDELADLMMVSAQEVEDHIMRITQKARAAGIHLIVATQRPTVDVITGTIKSNIPSRIAFTVAQANDSRVILDENGAQTLLGYGDLLLSQSGSKLKRVQGSYISDEEIDRVVDMVRRQGRPKYLIEDQYFNKEKNDSRIESDPLIRQAMEFFLERGHATVSSLQTRMGIGYNRAARIVDILEQQGLISEPHSTTKKREVKITHEELGIIFDGTRG